MSTVLNPIPSGGGLDLICSGTFTNNYSDVSGTELNSLLSGLDYSALLLLITGGVIGNGRGYSLITGFNQVAKLTPEYDTYHMAMIDQYEYVMFTSKSNKGAIELHLSGWTFSDSTRYSLYGIK